MQANQALAETALKLCRADTAGVSLLERLSDDNIVFRWVALAGRLRRFIGGWTPRKFSPCGLSVDRGAPQLLRFPERHFTYLAQLRLPIADCLVLPFYKGNQAIGAIWILAHSERRKFDREDLRAMQRLADVAGAIVQLTEQSRATALAEERARLVGSLHDRMAHLFLTIGFTIDACLHEVKALPRLQRPMRDLRRQTEDLFSELRQVIKGLDDRRPPSSDDFVAAVTRLVGGFGRLTGVVTHLACEGSMDATSPEMRSVLLAIVHEALANVAKHARAANVWIKVECWRDVVLFDIADDGVGVRDRVVTAALRATSDHFGLRTIADRVEAGHGTVTFTRRRPRGFRLSGRLPLTAPVARAANDRR